MKENNREGCAQKTRLNFKKNSILHHFPAIKEGLRLATVEFGEKLKALSKQP
jgi:hypothetical protein